MARGDPQILLRVPEGLKDAITERARKNGRSINAEILMMLSSVFEIDSFISQSYKDLDIPKLDETKATQLELLQEKYIEAQRAHHNSMKKLLGAILDTPCDKKPT